MMIKIKKIQDFILNLKFQKKVSQEKLIPIPQNTN